ncbi:hypothetical protein, partial [Acidithiobacillus sp.]|uniref:hypothetical protein n=1 Tax=Acidithiobacillus sp. TaxID=1872118 RepID=UPI003D08876D
ESFVNIHHPIVLLVEDLKAGIADHDDRFCARCDELRSQLSELGEIFRDCAQLRLIPNMAAEMESVRILSMMVSHMELMFLYARKNPISARFHQKEVDLTVREFLSRQARLGKDISWS